MTNEKLLAGVRTAVQKVQKFKDRTLGEQNTKASLIEPILEALGGTCGTRTRSTASSSRPRGTVRSIMPSSSSASRDCS